MRRCCEIHQVAKGLFEFLKGSVPDPNGFVTHEVEYEHRDPSSRGRLFAVGKQVKVFEDTFPRTTTLQGMPSDLRAPLVGAFGHDIDCENSDTRILCSLAMQLGLEKLVPTLFKYRDNRQGWIEKISELHDVKSAQAKRLPTIIYSGGTYETWKKLLGVATSTYSENEQTVTHFVHKLGGEARALRDQLLKHPRFRWTSIDREKIEADGKNGGAVDTALLPRIIQYCENVILEKLHYAFHDLDWIVRAKIFDGLIVEKGPEAECDLEAAMRMIEKSLSQNWEIKLVEKPMYGKQDEPMKTLLASRKLIRSVLG